MIIIKFLKVEIYSWTSSFRQPLIISGYQPTLPTPPLSTLYGLLSASKGEIVDPSECRIGYIFFSSSKTIDLEKIYEVSSDGKAGSNVYKREFLFDVHLTLYLTDIKFQDYLKKPHFPLLLGRSCDLAFVKSMKLIDMKKIQEGFVQNTIIPKETQVENAELIRLSISFSQQIPRELKRSDLFWYVHKENKIKTTRKNFYFDPENQKGVFILPD